MSLTNLTPTQFRELSAGQIDTFVSSTHESISGSGDSRALPGYICSNWPFVRSVLLIAKIFTNDEIDAKIDAIIEVGDSSCD